MIAGLKLAIALLVIGYPLLVYLSLSYLDAKVLALVLILLAAARLACVGQDRRASSMLLALLLSLGSVAAIGFLVIVSGSPAFLRYYPVCMNAVMLLLFGLSLLRPPSMIERIARIREPNLPDAAVRYTRTVTEVWCLFFGIGGALHRACRGH
jgi:uncharacterized membrane protein